MARPLLVVLAACDGSGSAPIDAPDAIGLEAGLGTLAVAPTTFDLPFGAGDVGYAFSITNTWVVPTAPLATAITGADASGYELKNDTCRGVALADGASCTLEVALPCSYPTTGYRDAVLTVEAMPGGSVRVPLHGRINAKSCGPFLTLGGSPHSFGDQAVGTTSSAGRFAITNAGGKASAPLTVMLGGSDPGHFLIAASTCAGAVVPPGGSCSIDVAFAPQSTGPKSAFVAVGTVVGGVSGTGVTP